MRNVILVVAAFMAFGQAGCSSTGSVRSVDLLIVGGTAIDPASQTVGWNSGIAIDDGIIVAIHAGADDFDAANTLNASDRYIVPAFVDMRAHWEAGNVPDGGDLVEGDAERSLYYGVTRNFDVLPLRATDAIRTPDDVRQEVARLASSGADVIEIVSSLSPQNLRTAVEAAREAGLTVAVHAATPEELLVALDSRVDAASLAITVTGPVDPSMYSRMGDAGVFYIATQNTIGGMMTGATNRSRLADPFLRETLTASEADLLQQDYALSPEASQVAGLEPSLNYVREAQRAGAILLTGSDLGGPFMFPGYSIHEELWSLVDAGIEPIAALAAASSNAAVLLGQQNNWGSIEAGHAADLLLLKANPLADIHNTRRIGEVIQGGRIVDRAALLD